MQTLCDDHPRGLADGNAVYPGDSFAAGSIVLDNTCMNIASGPDTIITVFCNGGSADQVIVLAGFDAIGLNSIQIIENRLTYGNRVATDII